MKQLSKKDCRDVARGKIPKDWSASTNRIQTMQNEAMTKIYFLTKDMDDETANKVLKHVAPIIFDDFCAEHLRMEKEKIVQRDGVFYIKASSIAIKQFKELWQSSGGSEKIVEMYDKFSRSY